MNILCNKVSLKGGDKEYDIGVGGIMQKCKCIWPQWIYIFINLTRKELILRMLRIYFNIYEFLLWHSFKKILRLLRGHFSEFLLLSSQFRWITFSIIRDTMMQLNEVQLLFYRIRNCMNQQIMYLTFFIYRNSNTLSFVILTYKVINY